MELHPLVDSPSVFIAHDTVNQCLYADWRGDYNQELSRSTCRMLLAVQRQRPYPRLLNDYSSMTRTTVELTLWGQQWLADMQAAGLRCIAWVLPTDPLARQVTEHIVQAIDQPRVVTFQDVASAYSWLQQQPLLSVPLSSN
ncbi:MAG: hypothetical protein M3Y54_03090 [Bacteroidota bacterium]|nr:hypothetical protein [Bacteroidota bacterium]